MKRLITTGAAAAIVALAAAGSALAAVDVGTATVVVKQVEGVLEKNQRLLNMQDRVYLDEMIRTAEESASVITFLDKSQISVGPNSEVVLDRFVFDPDTAKGTFSINVVQGVFRFASGTMAKSAYVIRTPVATMGIRGTEFTIVVEPNGTTNVTVASGMVMIENCVGEKVTLDRSGLSTTIRASVEGTCLAPTEPGPQAPRYAALVERMDGTLARIRGD